MYWEARSDNKSGWKYTYSGKELLEPAKAKYQEFLTKEKEARMKMSELMADMDVSTEDPRIRECKKDIEANGSLREQCGVFVHEFGRTPEREFHLALGDVVFFELVKIEKA